MKSIILTNLFVILCFMGFSQKQIEGRVLSETSNEPLPFVNIIALESKVGTSSGMDGEFTLTVPENEKYLVFSYIGFKQDTVAIGANPVIVYLTEESQVLDEVVVTALGIKREKKSIGYAISEVKGDELKRGGELSVVNKLAGKVAGLDISSTNGGAGASSRIILRGNNSITGDNQALIVVDGVPINNTTTSNSGGEWGGKDYGNGVSDINPDDIESVSILKGASASALYGSQAMDGVILITTKKGKARKGVGVSFSTNTSIDMPYILYDFQDVYGAGRNGKFEGSWEYVDGTPMYISSNNESFGSWGPKMEGQSIIDWDGEAKSFVAQPDNYANYFKNGMTTINSLGLDGGNKSLTWRFSLSDMRMSDIVPNSSIGKTNLGLNLGLNLTKKIQINVYASYMRQAAKNRPATSDAHDNPNRNYIMMPRHISSESLSNRIMDESGYETTWYTNWNWMTNPYWNFENVQSGDDRDRVFGNIQLNYQITPKLKFMMRAAPDYSDTYFYNKNAKFGLMSGLGDFSESRDQHFLINSDALLTYDGKIGKNWTFGLNAGANSMYYEKDYYTAHTEGGLIENNIYTLENSVNPVYKRTTEYKSAKNSVYAFGQLGFKDFLYLDLTARNDWSSTLPSGNNSFFYPSVSLGFVYSELFNRDVIPESGFSFGKFRISYAGVGNDAEPYQLETTYEIVDNQGYGDMMFINRTVPNLGLLPELVNSFELGSDMKFFMDRIGLDITYYDTRSHNQIAHMPVSSASGYFNAIVNSGIIMNRGIEVQANIMPVKKNKFRWNAVLAFAKNESEVIELAPNVERVELYEHWRMTIEARPGNPYGDIVGFGFQRDENDNIIVDKSGMPLRDENPKVLGNFTPDFSLSLSNTFNIGNFSIMAHVHAKIGGEMFAGTNMYGYGYSGNFEETLEGREEWYASEAEREAAGISQEDWTPTGGLLIEGVYADGTTLNGEDIGGTTNVSYIDPYQYYQKVSLWYEEIHEPFIYDASFVKLRELSVSYNVPKKILSKMKIKGASVGVYGKNLWLIYSKVPNIDPESMLTNGNGQGYELYSYPNRRSIGFTINLNI